MSISKQRLSQTTTYERIRKKIEPDNVAQLTLNAENLGEGGNQQVLKQSWKASERKKTWDYVEKETN